MLSGLETSIQIQLFVVFEQTGQIAPQQGTVLLEDTSFLPVGEHLAKLQVFPSCTGTWYLSRVG